MNFVKRNIKLGSTNGEVYRENRWEYPLLALREIIIHAVVHRDYSILGSDIKVAIFDDMIEVTSPGVFLIDKELKQYSEIEFIIDDESSFTQMKFVKIKSQETAQETLKKGSTKRNIIEEIKKNPNITRNELSFIIGVSPSDIKKQLFQLKKD